VEFRADAGDVIETAGSCNTHGMRRHALLFSSLFALACDTQPGDSGSGGEAEENSTETETTDEGGSLVCGDHSCASGEYCDWLDNKCGTVPDTPECEPEADDCNSETLVCGCDGEVYTSTCAANAAGTDLGEFTCEPPEGMFACGTHLCGVESEFCEHVPSDGFAPWAVWGCATTPTECADDWSCACLQPLYDPAMECTCTDGGGLGVRISCSSGVGG
jgi:hypothetical protein